VGALGVPVRVLVADGVWVRGVWVRLELIEYESVILAESENEETERLIPETESVMVGLAEPEGLPGDKLRLLVAEREKDRVQVCVGASVGVSVGLRLWDGKVAVHEDSVGLQVTLSERVWVGVGVGVPVALFEDEQLGEELAEVELVTEMTSDVVKEADGVADGDADDEKEVVPLNVYVDVGFFVVDGLRVGDGGEIVAETDSEVAEKGEPEGLHVWVDKVRERLMSDGVPVAVDHVRPDGEEVAEAVDIEWLGSEAVPDAVDRVWDQLPEPVGGVTVPLRVQESVETETEGESDVVDDGDAERRDGVGLGVGDGLLDPVGDDDLLGPETEAVEVPLAESLAVILNVRERLLLSLPEPVWDRDALDVHVALRVGAVPVADRLCGLREHDSVSVMVNDVVADLDGDRVTERDHEPVWVEVGSGL